MSVLKVLMRDWVLKIAVPATTPAYKDIAGLLSLGVTRSAIRDETTDWDSEGLAEHAVVERGAEVAIEGFWMETDGGAIDEGQALLLDASEEMGADSLYLFQLTSPGSKVWSFEASVHMDGPTGDRNAHGRWSATLVVSGGLAKPA